MAAPTLSTSISHPSMLPRAVPAAPAFAALDRDAELLRWVAAAGRYWDAFACETALCDWLADAVGRHPEVPRPMVDSPEARERWDAVAARLGLPQADARRARLRGRYERAARAAFGIPAAALPGVLGKMRLGVAVATLHQTRNDVPVDIGCLDLVLADLERIAGPGMAASGRRRRP